MKRYLVILTAALMAAACQPVMAAPQGITQIMTQHRAVFTVDDMAAIMVAAYQDGYDFAKEQASKGKSVCWRDS